MPDSAVRDADGGQRLVVVIRRNPFPPFRRVAAAMLATWLLAVLAIALWPHHVDRAAAPHLQRVLARLHDAGVLQWLTYERLEVLANVGMLVPLGLLVVLALGRRFAPAALAVGPILSVLVEAIQWTMPHRTASLIDVAANSLGSAIGVALGALLDGCATRRRRRRAEAALAAARRGASTRG